MSMYVKIMGPEDLADDDSRKTYRLIKVKDAQFLRYELQSGAYLRCTYESGKSEDIDVLGNAYIMNEHGRTIASFGAADPARDIQIKAGNMLRQRAVAGTEVA